MFAGWRVIGISKPISGWVPAGPGLLYERTATRLKRASKAHRQTDPADYRPGDVSDDLAKHPRRNLPRKRLLRTRQQQVNDLALQAAATDLLYHGGGRKQPLRLGHIAGNAE